jgi:adenine/guanine phosphoribosyltransferase-like PRPP-binding protein
VATKPEPNRERVIVDDVGDAGISMTTVLVMMVVLGLLVVGIFWALPAWFGSQVVEITVR